MAGLVTAYLGLGANLGRRQETIDRAVRLLARANGVKLIRVAEAIETDPVGGPEDQPRYLNTACCVETTLSARQLLDACLRIEKELGRDRGPDAVRWGPRVIDIDLLLYGDAVLDEDGLCVPHPRLQERGFVLIPLEQIAAGAQHPVLHKTVAELLSLWKNSQPAQ